MRLETIVLIDDDDSNLRTLGGILRRKGYEVLSCTSLQAALRMIESVTPALIIANVLMESMNGFEISERIHARARLADTPIVLMSTQAHDLPFQGQSSHLRAFLAKPIQTDEVLGLVNRILSARLPARHTVVVQVAEPVIEP